MGDHQCTVPDHDTHRLDGHTRQDSKVSALKIALRKLLCDAHVVLCLHSTLTEKSSMKWSCCTWRSPLRSYRRSLSTFVTINNVRSPSALDSAESAARWPVANCTLLSVG